jgi:geranylgeranyl diphosphate synthase type I
LDLEKTTSTSLAHKAIEVLINTCLHLTKGQFLDITYENHSNLTLDDYWPMIGGKTAVLLAACTELGALVAGVNEDTQNHYRSFGWNLGLAFQALDDILGIWGDSGKVGKSIASDLVEGKNSLPVLFGLEKNGDFAKRWKFEQIRSEDVPLLAKLLEDEGARAYTQETADRFTKQALQDLEKANPLGEAGISQRLLANHLLNRQI